MRNPGFLDGAFSSLWVCLPAPSLLAWEKLCAKAEAEGGKRSQWVWSTVEGTLVLIPG